MTPEELYQLEHDISHGEASATQLHALVDALRAAWAERDIAQKTADIWKNEHAKVHGDWLETRKKCTDLIKQARNEALEEAARRIEPKETAKLDIRVQLAFAQGAIRSLKDKP